MGSLTQAFANLKGKRVVITGDTGFKGSWLSLWLHLAGAEVYGYALPPENSQSHFSQLELEKIIHHEHGDVRDADHLTRFIKQSRPEIVFHLAAQALVRRSYIDPKTTYDTNIGGAINLLEAVHQTDSIRALVFVTSDKCYKNIEVSRGYRETDELGGRDPYSASKAAAELVFSSFFESFLAKRENFGAATVRAGNVIGGGDWAEDRIIPDCIRALSNNRPIVLRFPNATRPWQHVLEPLSGYIQTADFLLSSPAKYNGAWNFGPAESDKYSVLDVAKKAIDVWGAGEIKVDQTQTQMHEAGLLHLNCEKANSQMNWFPKWNFDQTLTNTVSWYRQAHDGRHIRELSESQIKEYMGMKND